MTWVKLDDAFPENEKAERAGDHACWLYVAALCYCNRNRTDGLIPRARVAKLTGLPRPLKLAERLVGAGLWDEDGEDFRVHNYHDFQPSKAKLDADDAELSAKRAAAGRKGAERKWHGKRGGNGNGKPMANGQQTDDPVAVPASPEPPPVSPASGGEAHERLEQVKERLKGELASGDFDRWVAPLEPQQMLDGAMVVKAPSDTALWVRDRYTDVLAKAAGCPVRVAESEAEREERLRQERKVARLARRSA